MLALIMPRHLLQEKYNKGKYSLPFWDETSESNQRNFLEDKKLYCFMLLSFLIIMKIMTLHLRVDGNKDELCWGSLISLFVLMMSWWRKAKNLSKIDLKNNEKRGPKIL